MVETIDRDKNDIFGYKWGERFFKNPKTLFVVRVSVLIIFIYALLYGFMYPTKEENIFTTAIFWSIFWPFFMFLSLPTLGAYFCSVCPLAFIGKKITLFGLGIKFPKILKHRGISLTTVLLIYWGLFYAFPDLFGKPVVVAIFYTTFTLIAFAFYFIFSDMSYCRYICPISAIRNAYSRVGFMWLGTYESACNTCKTFECAKACEFGQSPFNFNKNNSMGDCTLCMDCAHACAAVGYTAHKPGFSLLSLINKKNYTDVWSYILLFAFMTLTLKITNNLNHSEIQNWLPWMQMSAALKNIFPQTHVNIEALSTLLFSLIMTLTLVLAAFKFASKKLNKKFGELFLDVGYAYAPLPLIGSLTFAAQFFFTRYFHHVINGFIQALHLPYAYIKPLALPSAPWLQYFMIFDYIAVAWTIALIFKRVWLIAPHSPVKIKIISSAVLSLLPLIYLWI